MNLERRRADRALEEVINCGNQLSSRQWNYLGLSPRLTPLSQSPVRLITYCQVATYSSCVLCPHFCLDLRSFRKCRRSSPEVVFSAPCFTRSKYTISCYSLLSIVHQLDSTWSPRSILDLSLTGQWELIYLLATGKIIANEQ